MTLSSHDGWVETEPIGTMQVRAWLHDRSLAARVTHTPDVAEVTPVTVVITKPSQLYGEVARWPHELGVADESWCGDNR